MKEKIKVLHLFNTYLPNTENWAYHLIANTPEVEIFVAAKDYIDGSFPNDGFTFYQHPFGKLESHYIQLNKANPIQLLQKIYIRLFKYPKFLLDGILSFAQINEVNIIHVHFANMGWFYRKIALKLDKPLIISFYGWDYEQLPFLSPKYKKRFKKLFAQADAIICEGPHGAHTLASYGCPKEKIHIVRLGVQVNRIKFTRRTKKNKELKLLQLASFTPKKGHIYTVKAFYQALRDCPNMSLTLVGGISEIQTRQAITNFIQTHQLQNKITIIDAIDYALLHSFLADYQVFIQPSCYTDDMDCEGGAPIALLDAQATGMPVIATTHCDIPMEVLDGQTGLLAPEKDIGTLSENIKRFYEMGQAQYDAFAQAGREHVEREFDIRKNAQKLLKIYESSTS
ncbi:MAG TPA: glycosyltransferase [Saprospiraceae bacterium]|nr:glycosyltransferase [Saprospiraceae bacterium]